MKPAIVAIGASLGGLDALKTVLADLPASFRPPVAIVQHRAAVEPDSLAFVLRARSALPVAEAADKMALEERHVYLAPPDYHLLAEGDHFALCTDEPVHHARPSIDVFFESVAASFGPRAVGIVLTGTGADGALGLTAIRREGGLAVVESPATAVAPEMPAAAVRAVAAAVQLPLAAIAPYLLQLA